jgi:hypothetical protein
MLLTVALMLLHARLRRSGYRHGRAVHGEAHMTGASGDARSDTPTMILSDAQLALVAQAANLLPPPNAA